MSSYMRIPATDYEMSRPYAGVTEAEFDKRKALWEGINGRDRMNTRFENTERVQVLVPRGDLRGRPMPRDARFCQADNHGEWGNDKFMERLECGMDGPDSKDSYHGAGLPTRSDLSYPANRDHPGALAPLGNAPTDEGIDGDA